MKFKVIQIFLNFQLVLECSGKYKDSIKEAINKYKIKFSYFENQIYDLNFYNDVKNSKYI